MNISSNKPICNLVIWIKAKEVLKILQNDGWFFVRQKGSHRQWKHGEKKGLVTLAFHKLSDEIAPGILNSIFKQA